MKSRKIARVTTNNGVKIEWVPMAYLNEGVRMAVKGSTLLNKVTAKLVLKSGISTDVIGVYEEERYAYNGNVYFDFAEYLQQVYYLNIHRLIPTKTEGDGIIKETYIISDWGEFKNTNNPIAEIQLTISSSGIADETKTIYYPFFVVPGDNETQEEMCKTRYHQLPINYPCVAEFVSGLYDNNHDIVATASISFDNSTEDVIIDETIEADREYKTLQFNITDQIDERYREDFRQLKISYPFHVETQAEKCSVEATSWMGLSKMKELIDLDTREDVYIINAKTKGAFLRFFDRFGFVQQILLDIYAEETSYTNNSIGLANDIKTFGYANLDKQWDVNINMGSRDIVRKSETRTMHCSLQSVSSALREDLEDLILSPCVALLELDNGTEYWRKVVLTASNITKGGKANVIDFKCDLIIGNR